jgi:putative peptide zinc metalloprotease protein
MAVANQMFVLGVVLAFWTIWSSLVWPLLKMAHHVMASPVLDRHRSRALLVSIGAVCAAVALLALVPAPLHTVAEGVVWLPADTAVRAGADGFVQRLAVEPGGRVKSGDLLAEADDPELRAKVAAGEARVAALRARLGGEEFADRVRAGMTRREIDIESAALERDRSLLSALQMRSPSAGTFSMDTAQDWSGRYVKRGERLGNVLPDQAEIVRVVVRQQDVDLVRTRLRGVRVLTSSDPARPVGARVLREVPQGSDELPSRAFSTEGGGELAIDPTERSKAKTLSRTFQFDLQLDGVRPTVAAAHVWARFDHGDEPVAVQAYRRLRQVFLAHFNA